MIWPLIALLAPRPPAPTCRTTDRRVESVIAAKAKEMKGVEYCQARLYHTVDDVDGDDREDFILVFTIEAAGGNNSTQYLAVFPSSHDWKPVVLTVGGRGERFIDEIDIEEDGVVVLLTSEYEEGDPMCCPSGEGELRYKYVEGRLIPLPATPPGRTTQSTSAAPARPREPDHGRPRIKVTREGNP